LFFAFLLFVFCFSSFLFFPHAYCVTDSVAESTAFMGLVWFIWPFWLPLGLGGVWPYATAETDTKRKLNRKHNEGHKTGGRSFS
jgi:hypothetical protein